MRVSLSWSGLPVLLRPASLAFTTLRSGSVCTSTTSGTSTRFTPYVDQVNRGLANNNIIMAISPRIPFSGMANPTSPEMCPARSAHRLADQLERPALDDRSYRVIRLPNQLEALLVHDAETDKASAAMDVNVGSFSDPEDMPGMAHAVEHLLFMGTEKVRLVLSARL